MVAAAGVPGLITAGDGQARAPPSSTSASAGSTGRSPATSPSTSCDVAGFVAPNPGGVGPMTRAMLLQNVVLAAEQAAALEALTA